MVAPHSTACNEVHVLTRTCFSVEGRQDKNSGRRPNRWRRPNRFATQRVGRQSWRRGRRASRWVRSCDWSGRNSLSHSMPVLGAHTLVGMNFARYPPISLRVRSRQSWSHSRSRAQFPLDDCSGFLLAEFIFSRACERRKSVYGIAASWSNPRGVGWFFSILTTMAGSMFMTMGERTRRRTDV